MLQEGGDQYAGKTIIPMQWHESVPRNCSFWISVYQSAYGCPSYHECLKLLLDKGLGQRRHMEAGTNPEA
jgi:hypothetical protein